MGTNIKLIDNVMDVARRISTDAKDSMNRGGIDASEDWADALSSVGELFKYASAKMLIDAYPEQAEMPYMRQMINDAKEQADEALGTLGAFGININTLEMLGE